MNNQMDTNYHQSVFLDHTALAAFMNPEDPFYWKARSLFFDLDDLDRHLVTTNYVVFDVHDWLRTNYDYDRAQFFLNVIEKTAGLGKLAVIPSRPQLEEEAKQLLFDCPNCRFSLNEAVTAAVLLTYGIKRIFTFNPVFLSLPRLDPGIKLMPGIR